MRHRRIVKASIRRHGYKPDVALPGKMPERMLWRKIFDHNPLFTLFCDKLATKEYQRERCPEMKQPKVLWAGLDANDIPDEALGGDVYVKASHGCNFNLRLCRGDRVDRKKLKETADGWLAQGYGHVHGESAYRGVGRRLFVEESVGDADAGMVEIQVRAGWGNVVMGSVSGHIKTPRQWVVYLDDEGRIMKGGAGFAHGVLEELPAGVNVTHAYAAACEFSRRLSRGVDYARFDFFWNGRDVYAGEITVYPGAGIGPLDDPKLYSMVRAGWRLENTWFLNTPQKWPASLYASALKRRLAKDPDAI